MKKKIFSTLLLVAFALASTSMFVSCKDYDDDINRKADASVVDALQKTVDQLKADLATCKSNCEAAHATFALKTELAKTNGDVALLQDAVKALQEEMKNLVTAQKLQAAIEDAQKALNDAIDKKADKAVVDELSGKLAGLDSKYEDILGKVADIDKKLAAIENLKTQVEVLEAYKQRVENLEKELANKLNEDQVKALIGAATADFATVQALAKLQEIVDAKANGADITRIDQLIVELRGKLEECSGTIVTKEQIEQMIATQILAVTGGMTSEQMKQYIAQALSDYATKDFVTEKINELNDIINGVEGGEGLKDQMEAAEKKVNALSNNLNVLQYLLAKMITSIVNTNPIMFLGIETVEAPALALQPVITRTGKEINEVYRYNDGKGGEYDGEAMPRLVAPASYKEFFANPWIVLQEFRDVKHDTYAVANEAQYHINPSTANLNDWNLSFYTDERLVVEEIESRTGVKEEFVTPIETAAAKNDFQGGILTVPFKINDNYKFGKYNGKDLTGWEAYIEKLVSGINTLAAPTPESYPWGTTDTNLGVIRDNVFFIALQAKNAAKDTTVTSDYAMVAPVAYHVNGICDNDPIVGEPFAMPDCCPLVKRLTPGDAFGGGDLIRNYHMYKKAKTAADNAETHQIAYNETTEVFNFVETHFAYIGFNSDWDYSGQMLDPVHDKKYDANGRVISHKRDTELMTKLGLGYRITPLHWNSGSNETDETAHITYNIYKGGEIVANEETADKWVGIPDSVVVTPRPVNADTGKTIKDGDVADNTREIIDREPMLRIEVIDKLGNVIEVGYMKMKITERPLAPGAVVDPEVTLPLVGPYYYNCEFADEVTWHQVEGYVLRGDKFDDPVRGLTRGVALNVTKKEFEKHWALELDEAGNVVRYDWSGKTPVLQKPIIGEIVEKYNGLARETSVLRWTFTASDWANIAGVNGVNLVRNEAGQLVNKNPIETWVRYVNDGGEFKAKGDVYVKLVIPAQSIIFPEGTLSNHRYGYWYELNTNTPIKDELNNVEKAIDTHMNVRTPKDSYTVPVLTTDEFKKNLFEYFTSREIIGLKEAAKFAKISKEAGFMFTTPAIEKENAVFDASKSGMWTVLGLSKTKYTLMLYHQAMKYDEEGNLVRGSRTSEIRTDLTKVDEFGNRLAANQIVINDVNKTVVCEILPAKPATGEIELKYAENDKAWDILNYAHRHALKNGPADAEKESFTAYIHVLATESCIPVTLDKAYFNVKFLRPINWYPQVVDAPIDATTGTAGDGYFYWNLEQFIKFTDWRLLAADVPDASKKGYNYPGDTKNYAVVRGYTVKVNADNTLTETTTKTIKNPEIEYWKYYGITFDSRATELYTDVANTDRNIIDLNAEPGKLKNLKKVSDLEGMDFQYVRNAADPTLSRFKYKNNEGTVDDFHVYVPIYITYTYGPKGSNLVIKAWGTLNVHKTVHGTAKKN